MLGPSSGRPGGEAEFDPSRPAISYLRIIYQVVADPKAFFLATPAAGLKAPALFSLISFALPGLALSLLVKEAVVLLIYGLVMGGWLLFIGLVHLVLARLFHGRGSFQATFRVAAYTSFTNLVGPVPYLGLATHIFGLYLAAQGLAGVHRLSTGRAALALVVVVGGLLGLNLFLLSLLLQPQP